LLYALGESFGPKEDSWAEDGAEIKTSAPGEDCTDSLKDFKKKPEPGEIDIWRGGLAFREKGKMGRARI